MAYVGKPIPGKFDALLVAGKGQYTADVSLPGMGFMAVLRSPVAHAHIVSLNVEAARRLPGVRLIVTGKEIQGCTNRISHTIDPRAFGGNSTDIYCLAIDRVRYVGEPVAAVVADDRYLAAEALDLLRPALSYIREEGAELVLGALTTHHTLATSPVVQSRCAILAEAAAGIGDVQIRHRGTLGGSTAHFDPAADYPPVCLALDAKFRIVGPSGERLVSAEEFFLGYMTTAVGPQELLTEVRVPVLPSGTGSAYAKLQRIEGGFAIVGVAAILKVRSSLCQEIALGIGGGGPIPFRLKDVESWCQGRKVDEQFIAEVTEAAYAASSEPTSELHADAAYKRDMVRVFTRRALRTALQRVSI